MDGKVPASDGAGTGGFSIFSMTASGLFSFASTTTVSTGSKSDDDDPADGAPAEGAPANGDPAGGDPAVCKTAVCKTAVCRTAVCRTEGAAGGFCVGDGVACTGVSVANRSSNRLTCMPLPGADRSGRNGALADSQGFSASTCSRMPMRDFSTVSSTAASGGVFSSTNSSASSSSFSALSASTRDAASFADSPRLSRRTSRLLALTPSFSSTDRAFSVSGGREKASIISCTKVFAC